MIAPDEYNLQRLFRYLEWVAIVFVAVSQLLWMFAVVKCDWLIEVSFLLLGLSGTLSFCTPRTMKWWSIKLICQIGLISLAGALGARQYYYVVLYVLATRAALSLPYRQLILFGGAVVLAHIVSSQYAVYALHNLHTMRRPVPGYYRKLVLEGEADLYFIVGMLTVTFLGRTLVNERASRAAEGSLAKEIEALAVRLEREKIARDMHDGLGHSLNASKIQLERALKILEEGKSDGVLDLLERCQKSTGSSLRKVRRASKTTKVGNLGLLETVTELVDQIKQEGALTFTIQFDHISPSIKVKLQLFYIIQECLNNVRKHASANHVEITLRVGDGLATLCLKDNGKGFDTSIQHAGFGRKGLIERAESIGATLETKSSIGHGTEILVRFPIVAAKAANTFA